MNERTKRIAALILAIVLVALQLVGCSKTNTQIKVENAETVTDVTPETEETEETNPDAEGWLEENLESIQESLLVGDYEKVIDTLLTMQDDLADNAQYNALLYIAYMGNGQEEEAKKLLENEDLDTEAFTNAVTENTEALKNKGYAGAADVQSSLEEHMAAAGLTPETYEAVVQLGAAIQDYAPGDASAYAARYAAALAQGDTEAANAILAEAEANGVNAETLKNASFEYIEEHGLTVVEVEDKEKSETRKVTWSGDGIVVKIEEAVINPDGTQTVTIKDREGRIFGIANYDKFGNPMNNVVYNYTTKTMELESIEEYDFVAGMMTQSNVNEDGSKTLRSKILFDYEGKCIGCSTYYDGVEDVWSEAAYSLYQLDFEDRNLTKFAYPHWDAAEQKYVINVDEYEYVYAAPILDGRKIYRLEDGSLYMNATYVYNKDASYIGMAEGIGEFYDQNGQLEVTARSVYADKMYYETLHKDGKYRENHMSEDMKSILIGDQYFADGTLDFRGFLYYTGEVHTGELDVYYDEDGRVVMKEYFEGEMKGSYEENLKETLKERTEFLYDDEGRAFYEQVVKYDGSNTILDATSRQDFYSGENKIATVIKGLKDGQFVQTGQEQYYYNADGTRSHSIYWEVENGAGTRTQETYYTYNEDGSKKVEVKNLVEGTSNVTESICNENGAVLTENAYKVDSAGNRVDVGIKNHTYNEDGSKKTEELRNLENGTTTVTEFTYDENGEKSDYTVTTTDANGNVTKKYYTAEGFEYQIAIVEEEPALPVTMSMETAETAEDETVENEEPAVEACEHGDSDADGMCDTCGGPVAVETCAHADEDADGKCDLCGETAAAETCAHADEDADGKCDLCGETAAAETCAHVDEDEDGKCDVCGEVPESEPAEGEATEGEATEGEATEGEATEDEAAANENTEVPSETPAAETDAQPPVKEETAEEPKKQEESDGNAMEK